MPPPPPPPPPAPPPGQIPGDPDSVSEAPQLHIAYHDGEHYNSVRRMGDLGQGPANVFINVSAVGERGVVEKGDGFVAWL